MDLLYHSETPGPTLYQVSRRALAKEPGLFAKHPVTLSLPAWWCTPVISALRRESQEDQTFKVTFS